MSVVRLRTWFVALMVLGVSLFGAVTTSTAQMSSSEGCTGPLGIGAEGDACVSIVHASPDAPNVDIYVDGNLALSNLAFGWWSGWLALPAGEHQVQVTPTGAAAADAVIDATLDLEAGVAYQVAATGFVAEIAPQVYVIDPSGLADGSARVTVMHTVPDAPAVDVAVTGGDVLIPGLEFPNMSDALDVPAGAYDLEVRVGGTEDVVLPLPGVELAANTLYNVYAIGSVETGIYPFVIPTTLHSASATPADAMAAAGCASILGIGGDEEACVNIVHASPDAPAVDVYVDGGLALEGLEFGAFSGWVALPAGEHQVQVTAAGAAPDTAVIDATVTLDAGVAYQVAATGYLDAITPQIYPADLTATGADSARIRVIHTSPDAPAVDIAVTGGDVLISNLEFPGASDALVVPAGTYDLEVRPAGTTDVALPLPGVVLEAGMTYDVFAIGSLADGSLTVLVVPSMVAAS
jgi:hypothetical protein